MYRKRRRKRKKENKEEEEEDVDEKEYPVRGIRRCQNEECRVIMNRDYNAAINIRQNLLHYIQHGDWCPRFKRNQNTLGSDKTVVTSRQVPIMFIDQGKLWL